MADSGITLRRMEIADQRWRAAIGDSVFAPPDAHFSNRLRAIAMAAEGEAVVLYEAAHSPALEWNPVTSENGPVSLSYELRPGGNRPGPTDLWQEFDRVIADLARAQAGTDFAAVADGFRALGRVATRIAGALDGEQTSTAEQGRR
jgi:hypothetical protein